LNQLRPKFGWWKIPKNERVGRGQIFAECIYPPACLGAPNLELKGRFFDENKNDLASMGGSVVPLYVVNGSSGNSNSSNSSTGNSRVCSRKLGFRNESRLCHTCAENHRRIGADQCAKCPNNDENWGLMVLGFFLVLGGLIFIAGTAIASAGKQELSESVQKILLNYFQVAAMARIFPLRWPAEVENLFDFQGAVSTVGDHLVNPDCVTSSATAAELFYSKQAMFACLPFLVTSMAFVFWYVYGMIKRKPFFEKRPTNTGVIPIASTPTSTDVVPIASTPKDKFVVTVGAIFYLMFPTLIGGAFKMFDCRIVGNGRWLHADMEESCNGERYQLMMPLLGVSQLILFVVGLPLLMLWFLLRNKHRLHSDVVQSRYGLFFGGYKDNRFYWEIVLSARKISIVGLGVFGPSLGPVRQAIVALLILFLFIVLEIVGDPFKETTARHKVLPRLEFFSLMVLFLTMWSGVFIYSSTKDTITVQFLTIFVVLISIAMMSWLILQLIRECVFENQQSAFMIGRRVKKLSKSFSFRRSNPTNRNDENDGETAEITTEPGEAKTSGSSYFGDTFRRMRFKRMSAEAQQKKIRSRTIEAADATYMENPALNVEMIRIRSGDGDVPVAPRL
jgi:hypothetical protein